MNHILLKLLLFRQTANADLHGSPLLYERGSVNTITAEALLLVKLVEN